MNEKIYKSMTFAGVSNIVVGVIVAVVGVATGIITIISGARLLEEKYVGIVPGSKLGKGFDKYVRLSYATSDENLEEALKRMAELAAAL